MTGERNTFSKSETEDTARTVRHANPCRGNARSVLTAMGDVAGSAAERKRLGGRERPTSTPLEQQVSGGADPQARSAAQKSRAQVWNNRPRELEIHKTSLETCSTSLQSASCRVKTGRSQFCTHVLTDSAAKAPSTSQSRRSKRAAQIMTPISTNTKHFRNTDGRTHTMIQTLQRPLTSASLPSSRLKRKNIKKKRQAQNEV